MAVAKPTITRSLPTTRANSLSILITRGGSDTILNDISQEIDPTETSEEKEDHETSNDDTAESQQKDEEFIIEESTIETEDKEEPNTEDSISTNNAVSSQPVSILFRTDMNNPLLDTSLELLVSRARNIESVKQTLSRMLPGKPPVESIRLVSDGILLPDSLVIDELLEDEEEDDDDNDERKEKTLTIVLDMIPPVDPKFATQFSKIYDMSTSDLLDAYVANVAAMYHSMSEGNNAESGNSKNIGEPQLLSVKLRDQAYHIRQQWIDQFPEKALVALQTTNTDSQTQVEDRRGQRYRPMYQGGPRTNLKRTLQTNLNIVRSQNDKNYANLYTFFLTIEQYSLS
jgi:hypothetical protein